MKSASLITLTKRLTEKQKKEILKSFKSGTNIDFLSQKYTCTTGTIIRNLKKNLGELKFKEFCNKIKSLKGKPKINKNQTIDLQKTNFDNFGGVNVLSMYYEVLNEISYNTWKQSLISNLDASMHLLVDSKIGNDTNDAYVAEGNLFAINHRVLVIELLDSTNPDNVASTFYNSNLPTGVNMKMVWVTTGYS